MIKLRNKLKSLNEKRWDIKRHRGEINKFKDSRRVAIYKKVSLTDEQKKAIDDLYVNNYGKKIPYTWHRHYTAFTGIFDVNYFPELLYIPEFEKYMNQNVEYCQVIADKNITPILASEVGVKMPKTHIYRANGIYKNSLKKDLAFKDVISELENIGEVFIKPAKDYNSGVGCFVADFKQGKDIITGKKVDEIIETIKGDFNIQEKVVCSESLRNLNPSSVNTFRIITYRWKGEYYHAPVILRIGRNGNYLDNAHAGGIFIGVTENGVLKDTAYTEFNDQFKEHPDTNVKFAGYKIADFPKVIEAACSMHRALPHVGCINWDFTIDQYNEPLMIELNVKGGGIWVSQMPHGCGPFGDNTKEVLQWLRRMNSMSPDERREHQFGY